MEKESKNKQRYGQHDRFEMNGQYENEHTAKCARANPSSSLASAAVASVLPGSRPWAAKNLSTARRVISLLRVKVNMKMEGAEGRNE